MERRVLLAIFLAFLVLYTWQALFVKPVPKPVNGSAPASASTATGSATPGAADSAAVSPASGVSATPARPAQPLAAALVADTAERDVRVETRDVIAVFTNKGARLKSWRLKHYVDQQR